MGRQDGEGNDWHRLLIAPAVERLLAVQPGERVLELACGNGQFARRLASIGARVVACDSSAAFLDCARLRTSEHSERIEYRLIDLTGEENLAALGTGEFDAAVCNMALMDIACITPLLRTLRRTLKAGSRFVFSVTHPCFNTNGTTLLVERDDYQRDGAATFSVRIRQYRSLAPQKGIGIAGQPHPHYYFHRPLHVLLGTCFAAGMMLDGLEEPAFTRSSANLAARWDNCGEIPAGPSSQAACARPVDFAAEPAHPVLNLASRRCRLRFHQESRVTGKRSDRDRAPTH